MGERGRSRSFLAVALLVIPVLAGNLPLPPAGGTAAPRPLWTFTAPGGLRGSPALADLDGDGALETVVSADGLGLVVLDANGSLEWTFSQPSIVVTSPLLADIDSDGRTELVAGTDSGTVFALSPDRSLLWTYKADGPVFSDITAADLDGDGLSEVAFSTGNGTVVAVGPDGREAWKYRTGGPVGACPALADFTGDGIPELAVAGSNGRLHLLDGGGLAIWNVSAGSPLLADPAVFDIDRDGRPEIITGAADGNVTAFRANGTAFWTFRAGGSVNSSIAVADQDGDGSPEVLFGCDDGRLYRLSPAGALEGMYYCGSPVGAPSPYQAGTARRTAFPAGDGRLRIVDGNDEMLLSYSAVAVPGTSCAVANLREDDLPAAVVNCDDHIVRCLPLAEIPTLEWRMRQHDERRTGAIAASPAGSLPGSLSWRTPLAGSPDGPPSVADLDGDGRAEVAVATTGGALYLLNGTSGAIRWRVDVPGPVMRPSSPLFCDIDGDSMAEVVWAGPDGALRALRPADGSVLWRSDLGIYEASPAAADLDGDGRTEIAIGADSGSFVTVDCASGLPERTLNLTDGVRATAALADLGGGQAMDAILSTAGSVLAVRNGTALWTSPEAVFLPTAPLIGDLDSDGTPDAVVGTGRGELQAYSGTDGRQLWDISLGAAVTEPPACAMLPGADPIGLVASLSDGSLAGVSGRDGAILWKVQAGATTSPSVADLDLDGAAEILIGTLTGLDAFTDIGAHLWHFPVPGGVLSSPAIADTDRDGTLEVVFGGRDGNLYSHSAGGRCLPGDAPWPQYRHDVSRTGNSLAGAGRFLPDLELGPGSIRPSPAFPDEGGTVRINVSVGNTGSAASPAFSVSLTDNGTPVDSPRYGLPLGAGATGVVAFSWTPRGGDHLLAVVVDSAGAVDELDELNNAGSRTVSVNFRPLPEPGRDLRVELGAAIRFDGSASRDPDGEIAAYLWTFGDGGSATGIAPVHRYQAFGRFNVTLEVTDDSGATARGSLEVTVNTPPRILDRFPAADVTMAENETRDFGVSVSDSEGDPVSVRWIFDDSEVGAGNLFTYCPDYSSQGNHTLEAEASDGSRTVSAGWNLTVNDSPSPIRSHTPPWRDLEAGPGEVLKFSVELGGGPASIGWYLDGSPVDGATGPGLALATGPSSVGSHSVLVVVNASCHLDRREWRLEVVRRNTPPSFHLIDPPGDSVLMIAHGTREFLAAAEDLEGGAMALQWYIDGAALLNQTGPLFVYEDRGGRGRLNITVVASDGELTSSHTWTVRVNIPPVAIFSASARTVEVGSAVAFDASASFDADGNLTARLWSFGDGSPPVAGGAAVSHTFGRPGVHVVTLRVTDDLGATVQGTLTVVVERAPEGVRSPGSGGLLSLAAAAVVALLEGVRYRRKRPPHQRD